MKKSELRELIREQVKAVLKEGIVTESQLKASVLSVGIINMTNGKTAHGWSIFDSKLTAYLTSGSYLLLAAPGTFKVNDSVELIGNDTGRRLSKNHTIVGESPTDKDELLKFLKSRYTNSLGLRQPVIKIETKSTNIE